MEKSTLTYGQLYTLYEFALETIASQKAELDELRYALESCSQSYRKLLEKMTY